MSDDEPPAYRPPPDPRSAARELLRFCDLLHTALEVGKRSLPPTNQAITLAVHLQNLLDAARTNLEVEAVRAERKRVREAKRARERDSTYERARRIDYRTDEECRADREAAEKAREARKAAKAAEAARLAREAELRRFPWRAGTQTITSCEIPGCRRGTGLRNVAVPASDGGMDEVVQACDWHTDNEVRAWASAR